MNSRARRKHRRRLSHIEAKSAPSELRIIEADGVVEIAAAEGESKLRKFTMAAYSGGLMRVNGFGDPVVVDLAGLNAVGGVRPILKNHDREQIVGHSDAVEITSRTIRVRGVVSGGGDAAEQVVRSSDNGFPWQASIGASVEQMTFVEAGETVKVNGRNFDGPLLVAKKTTLQEISFVPIGADDSTSARVAASATDNRVEILTMAFETWVEAKGFAPDDLTDVQRTFLVAQFEAERKPQPNEKPQEAVQAAAASTDDPDPIAELRAKRAAELERVAKIGEICAGKHADIEAKAVAEGWDATKCELEVLRASRPKAPAIHSTSHDAVCTLQAMQGAMVLGAGLPLDHKAFHSREAMAIGVPSWLRQEINAESRQKAMEAAHRFSHMSLLDICAESIRLDGRDVPIERTDKIRAAMSGGTLTNIFTTNVNTVVLATYMGASDTTRGWTSEKDVADFKLNERPRMTKKKGMKKLPRGATADHATRDDTGESYKIARYADQFVVDEQDIIDDSRDAINDMPVEMGESAARLRPDLGYSILFANATLVDGVALFAAGHTNLDTGAALASGTIKTGITKIGKQRENNVELNLEASHLIVPTDLQWTAGELLNSATVFQKGNTDAEFGSRNLIADKNLELRVEGRLANGVTDPATETVHAGQTADWYLAAAGSHTIEFGYLRGTGRVPQIRSFVLDKGAWGIGWDINMDIGAKALDFKGLYRGEG